MAFLRGRHSLIGLGTAANRDPFSWAVAYIIGRYPHARDHTSQLNIVGSQMYTTTFLLNHLCRADRQPYLVLTPPTLTRPHAHHKQMRYRDSLTR
jgi:hypothetical protein